MDEKKNSIRLFILSFVVVQIFLCGAVDGEEIWCIERERKALLGFKKEIIDAQNILSSWGSEEDKWECCKWNGILCSNRTGHVISLKLVGVGDYYAKRQLRGNISSILLELHHLTSLDLSYNAFSNNQIPEFIGFFKKLKHLNLRSCLFSGIVPHQLGNLTNLRTLDLGEIFFLKIDSLKWLSHLSSLSVLDLSYVTFIETTFETILLQYILNLPSLTELHLRNSKFPNVTSSVNLLVNSSSTSLSILDLSYIGLTSFPFSRLFNITRSLVSIDLSGNQLDGSIPDAFGEEIFLEDLYLSNNRFEGGIPKSLWNLSRLHTLVASNNRLEEPLHNLSGEAEVSLQSLNLFNNRITGSFPDLRKFSALRKLNLGNNKFKDNIPSTFWELSKLEVLDVSLNSFEGTISEAHLSKLHNLKLLDLSFNSLVLNLTHDWIPPFQLDEIYLGRCHMGPRFPSWLQNQRNFYALDLSFNNISEELPEWLWDFSFRFHYLDLSRNQISGRLPNLSNIDLLDLSFNNFSGVVPILHSKSFLVFLSNNMFQGSISSLCTTTYASLMLLDLSNNQISGELPNCWENMTRLTILNLADNNFSGEIPQSLGYSPILQRLHLRNNNFVGELPSSFKECQTLQMIDVGGNMLTGNIPSWIGTHLRSLIVLSFRGNRFHGSIPLELCQLTSIQILDLSRNNITGNIPHQCFNNFTFLPKKSSLWKAAFIFNVSRGEVKYISVIDEGLVQWKQQEFEYRKTLGLLTLVDLSSNKIMGNIPPEIFHLRGLVSLNLSRNHLTGNISSDIDRMEKLESLDLSRNHLSGNIPIAIGKLTFLQVLDLSNNNLSGKIPSSTQLQSFKASAYDGNIELCGPPLRNCQEDDLGSSSGNHGKHENGDEFTTQSILQEFYIPVVLGFIVGFWGIIGTLILKKSWRYAYFNFFSKITDWVYVKCTIYLTRFR